MAVACHDPGVGVRLRRDDKSCEEEPGEGGGSVGRGGLLCYGNEAGPVEPMDNGNWSGDAGKGVRPRPDLPGNHSCLPTDGQDHGTDELPLVACGHGRT